MICSKNLDDFCTLSNKVISQMSKWFAVNKLPLKLDKTNVIKFIAKYSLQYPLNTGYNDNHIEGGVKTKFLDLQIDNHLNWKTHIDQLVPKLSGACYAVRFMLHVSSIDTQINLLCLLSLSNEVWNNSLG
jgi:hypothetical protein